MNRTDEHSARAASAFRPDQSKRHPIVPPRELPHPDQKLRQRQSQQRRNDDSPPLWLMQEKRGEPIEHQARDHHVEIVPPPVIPRRSSGARKDVCKKNSTDGDAVETRCRVCFVRTQSAENRGDGDEPVGWQAEDEAGSADQALDQRERGNQQSGNYGVQSGEE